MSKFFNRNRKAGFTLVELIVVIAILAILAGIAIPVYSGYIKKANKAADLQLLGAVNAAVGAATIENNRIMLSGPTLKISGDKISGLTANEAGVSDSFLKFFAGNTDTPLKYYTEDNGFTSATAFVYAGGLFYPGDSDIPVEALAAQQAYAAQVLQAAWTGTSFETAGTAATVGTLSGVGNIISNSLGGGALSNLANMLDPESDDYDAEIAGMVSAMGLTGLTDAMINSEDGSLAAVMYIAGQTAGIDGANAMSTVNALISGMSDTNTTPVTLGNTTVDIPAAFMTALTGDGDDAATNLGLAYAAVTAFYNSDAFTGTVPSAPSSLSGMLRYMTGAMNNTEFREYIGTEQAAADLGAYTAAMGALSVSDVTSLDSTELENLLNGYLGNN